MIKNDRLYIYGEHEILNLYKQKWKGRYYKKLHGDKCGWSFPIEFRAVVENLLSSSINESETPNHSETSMEKDVDIPNHSETLMEKESETPNHSETSMEKYTDSKNPLETTEKHSSEWDIDIPIEVYEFFKKYLS
jgi:hypothetical protein